VQAAKTFAPATVFAVDTVSQRLEMAQTFGAIPVDATSVHPASFIQDHTDGRGADCVLECVGFVPALLDSLDYARAGGRISVIGVHSDQEVALPLNITFVKAIDLKFCGTANVVGRWDAVFPLLGNGSVEPEAIISHRLPLSDAVRGYKLFESREALKVVLTP
jgi:threonine dehydrogenase-like Zn-dependent dehydrogenase